MPLLTRWAIKTSFVYLGIALAVGILLAGQPLWHLPAYLAALFPGYVHLLVIGWLTLLIFGVAYWMFPKASMEQPHGNEMVCWSAYVLLAVGVILRVASEPNIHQAGGTFWGWLLAVSAILQWLGGMALVVVLWKRVKVK